MTALRFTNPLFPDVLVPVRVGAACVETPRARLTRLEREWDAASDAAQIRAEYDRLTFEVRSARESIEIEERQRRA